VYRNTVHNLAKLNLRCHPPNRVGLKQLQFYQQGPDPVRGNPMRIKIYCLYGGTAVLRSPHCFGVCLYTVRSQPV
jgi:hypothetical protein